MPFITTQIEIAATPAEVRKAFLDFDSYPTWASAHMKAIKVTSGDKDNIKSGDTLQVVLPGMTFSPTVLVNTSEEFKWRGSIPYIFTGDHSFQFKPSSTTPGQTTLVQSEDFSGMLSFLVGDNWSFGKQSKAGYEGFNQELKARVEAL